MSWSPSPKQIWDQIIDEWRVVPLDFQVDTTSLSLVPSSVIGMFPSMNLIKGIWVLTRFRGERFLGVRYGGLRLGRKPVSVVISKGLG